MRNPYKSPRVRELKQYSNFISKLVDWIVYPQYLLWCLSEKMPRLTLRIEEFVYLLMTPVRAVKGFIEAWFLGREWRQIWVASPILMALVVGFSIFYVNANRSRGRVYDGYYQGALDAMNESDFGRSDFLFSKLINHPSYKDKDPVLYHALISAAQSGNVERKALLQEKMINQREYEPAKRWLISQYVLGRKNVKSEAEALSAMAEGMIVNAPDAKNESYWRLMLAHVRRGVGDHRKAIEVLAEDQHKEPDGYLLYYQSLLAEGNKDKARDTLRDMLDYIEREDPEGERYFNQKIEGLSFLAPYLEGDLSLLREAIEAVKRKRALEPRENKKYSMWLSRLNIRLFQQILKGRDASLRGEAFQCFDRALEKNEVSSHAGAALFGVVSAKSGYSLLSSQLQEVSVKQGGCGVHLAMGLEASLDGELVRAELHLGVAYALNPRALKVMSLISRDLAKRVASVKFKEGLRLDSFRESQRILDLMLKVAPEERDTVMFDRCYVYSLLRDWDRVVSLVAPRLESLTGQDLLSGYNWLIQAHRNLGQKVKADEFRALMIKEAKTQKKM